MAEGRRRGRGRGRCCGPGSPDAWCISPARLCQIQVLLLAQNLLKICSRYSTRAVPAAADEGRGEGEAQQQQPHKLAQNLQMPQKKKRRNQAKDALPATAATLRRRRRQRWRQPLLNSAVHKIYDLLLVSGRGRAAGTGTGTGTRGTGRERIAPAFSINSSP